MIVNNNDITLYGWSLYLTYSLVIAVICAGVGLVIWRIAYRRPSST